MNGLSPLQTAVARLFFSLPESEGYLLAGGGALLATGLTHRPTFDLDFFGVPDAVDICRTCDGLVAALAQRGFVVDPTRRSATFARLHVVAVDELVIDLCLDSAPVRPPHASSVGPTFSPEELAGRKLLALFSRAEVRDFVDMYIVAPRVGPHVSVEIAAEIDLGFSERRLAAMLRAIDRLSDDEFEEFGIESADVRLFFHRWADELDAVNTD